MLEKKVLSSGLFCFLYNNKIKIALGSGSLMHAGLVQFASKMHQDALSIYRGQWVPHRIKIYIINVNRQKIYTFALMEICNDMRYI